MMDKYEVKNSPNPYLAANPVSKLFFWWLNPLFRKGYGRTLKTDDLYDVCPSDRSSNLGNRLEREWRSEVSRAKIRKNKPSLTSVLFRLFGKEYLLLGLLLIVREAAKICQPLILGRLIRYFSSNSVIAEWEAYMYALAMTISAVLLVMTFHPYVFHVMRLGMRMRIACNSLMYRKSLRLSSAGLDQTTSGQLINLMSNDVGKFDYAFVRMMYLVLGPLDAIAIHVLLWQSLGPSVLAGFSVLLLLIPLQILMGKLVSKYTLETNQVRRLGYVRAIATGPFFISAKLMALSVFVTYNLLGGVVTAEPVFVAMSMYESVRLSATSYVCYAITQVSEVRVAIKRIETFLQLPELERSAKRNSYISSTRIEKAGLSLKSVTARWHRMDGDEQPTIRDITLTVNPGKLLIMIGQVGAGKSTLLMSMLGELPVQRGELIVRGHVTYVSQQPWVFSATIRENVTLDEPFIKEKYETILRACALNKDIAAMPYGDMTIIGDRGALLSGGQRARINLARALYMNGDVYLLDDPLSAVDPAVGRHIFKHVVMGLLKDKPRILITHQQHFLKYADEILILKKGKIVHFGTFGMLSASGVDFKSFHRQIEESDAANIPADPSQSFSSSTPKVTRIRRYSRQDSTMSSMSLKENDAIEIQENNDAQIPVTEESQEGSVRWTVYFTYFRAGAGLPKFLLFVVVCLSVTGMYVMSDYWLSFWSKQEPTKPTSVSSAVIYNTTNVTLSLQKTYFYVSVYSGLVGGVFLLELIRALFFFGIAVSASKNLHNNMLKRMLKTNMYFFETNPIGRILNRFSKDVSMLDNRIPDLMFNILQCTLLILSMVVLVGVVNPWTFIPVLPICGLLVIVRRFYLRTSRDVHRLEGVARSPVYSHISSTLVGLSTLRACHVEDRFIDKFDLHQDEHTRPYFLLIGTTTWLGMHLDLLSALFLSAVTYCCVLASDSLDPALVGLTMTYAITGTGIFQWTVKSSADLENQMISVERVRDYSKLPVEAQDETKTKLPCNWPDDGNIYAEKLCLQYHPDAPLVLKDISFTIKSKEKIGIVGRSGAGKSSLVTVLFRLVEPQGKLSIDDMNVQSLCLNDLRRRISIIPQDPVLFKGNLRLNLDPLNEHEDSSLWSVLKEVELYETVKHISGGLDAVISEGGSNFSIGQRQLVCLARAILQRNKILVIDEATANVDRTTDRLIQQTIRDKFRDYTVLTVAHRLHTVIDSDRIMVFDAGRIVEFDIPYLLLSNTESFFSKIVNHTGTSESRRLIEAAKLSYERKMKISVDDDTYPGKVISFYLPGEDVKSVDGTQSETIVTRL